MPEFLCTGGYDGSQPSFHPRYPGHRSPDCLNVYVRDGALLKWPGYVPYDAQLPALPGPVRFLADFVKLDGNRFLVASDGRGLYVYVSGSHSWRNISLGYYATGTARIANDQTGRTVQGSGTYWLANVQAGDLFKFNSHADTAWTEIESVESNTSLTLVEPYKGEWTYIPWGAYGIYRPLTAGAADLLRGVVGKNVLLVTNGTDPILSWDGGTGPFVALAKTNGADNPPRARFLTTYHSRNLLVAANLSDDRQMLWHSDANDYGTWSPGTGVAAAYEFHLGDGNIMGVDGGAQYLYLFFEKGPWVGQWTDIAQGIMWERVPSPEGISAAGSLLRLGAQGKVLQEGAQALWMWMGATRFYAFDGVRVRPIGEEIRKWVWDRLDLAYVEKIVGTVVPEWHLAIWSFPTRGSAGVNTHSVAYDYQSGEWWPADVGFSAFADYDLSAADVTWADMEGTWEEQTRLWDMPGSIPQPVTLVGDEVGNVYYLALNANRNGAVIDAYRRTPIFLPGASREGKVRATDLQEVQLPCVALPGSSFQVSAYGAENPVGLELKESYPVPVSAGGEVRQGFASAGKAWQIEVRNSEANGQMGLVIVLAQVRVRNK